MASLPDPRVDLWARYWSAIFSTLTAAAIGWLALTMHDTAATADVLIERTANIQQRLGALEIKVENGTADSYRSADARRDLGRVEGTLRDHDQRLRAVEAITYRGMDGRAKGGGQ